VIDCAVYGKFKEDYIKKAGTPEKNTWDIFADYCLGVAHQWLARGIESIVLI
jgi:hypothetical protein